MLTFCSGLIYAEAVKKPKSTKGRPISAVETKSVSFRLSLPAIQKLREMAEEEYLEMGTMLRKIVMERLYPKIKPAYREAKRATEKE